MSILMRRIFLCAIGLLAGLAAWPVIETVLLFQKNFSSYLIFSVFLGAIYGLLMGSFFGTTEGIILSIKRRIWTGMITGFLVGIIGGVMGFLIGQSSLFIIGEFFIRSNYSFNNFGLPLSRALGWAFLGIFIGIKIRKWREAKKIMSATSILKITEEDLDCGRTPRKKEKPVMRFEEYDECQLCMEDYSKNRVKIQLPCDKERKVTHDFCKPCLIQWSQKQDTCPTCERDGLKRLLLNNNNNNNQ